MEQAIAPRGRVAEQASPGVLPAAGPPGEQALREALLLVPGGTMDAQNWTVCLQQDIGPHSFDTLASPMPHKDRLPSVDVKVLVPQQQNVEQVHVGARRACSRD